MYRVSTAFAFKTGAADFLRAQSKQVEATQQINGKRAVDLQGFGRQSETLIASRTVKARADNFIEMHKLLGGRLDAQDQALGRIQQAAEKASELVLGAISSDRAPSLMTSLDDLYGQAVDALNWTHDGRHLFAGAQVDQKPVVIDTLAGLAAAPATADAFKNDQTRTTSRLNETNSMRTGFLADEVGSELFDVLKTIQRYHEDPATGPLSGDLTPAQSTFLNARLGELNKAFKNLLDRGAENGILQKRVDDARDSQSRRSSQLEAFIAEISEVDLAEAISNLQQAEMAVQASAKALNSLRESSLLNYLR
jgi:flagellar hook-associated protein 3 FlgL